MSSQSKDSFEVPAEVLRQSIEGAVKARAEKAYDDFKVELLARLGREKAEVVAGIVIESMRMVDMAVMQDRIVFTIRQPKV